MTGDEPYTLMASSFYVDDDRDGLDAQQEEQFGTSDSAADPDPDQDGLDNSVELWLGTDPSSADSDGDLVPDNIELQWGTDPGNTNEWNWSSDSDGDGLTLEQEYACGSDPNDAESVGDTNTIVSVEVTLGSTADLFGYGYELSFTAKNHTIQSVASAGIQQTSSSLYFRKGESYDFKLERIDEDWKCVIPEKCYVANLSPSDEDGGVALVQTDPSEVLGEHDDSPETDALFANGAVTGRVDVVNVFVGLTAHRPVTEGPNYGNPFMDHEVPDDDEESPGAGIRVNGDTELAVNENDLVEVELEVDPLPSQPGIQYYLRRNEGNIKVWSNRQMADALLDSGDESLVAITNSVMSVWVECPNGGDDDLELVAKDADGMEICSDKIHFYPFTSVVVIFEGEFGTPADPAQTGISHLALSIYESGYDVHLYDEPDAHENFNGEEDALLEIANATRDRQVSQVVIMGYSHGGGSTFNVADNFDGTITMTAYIDAVSQPLVNTSRETRFPPGSQFHLNYYQVGVAWPLNDPFYDLGLDGGPVAGAVNINLDQNGQEETHTTIDDNQTVFDGICSALFQRVSK